MSDKPETPETKEETDVQAAETDSGASDTAENATKEAQNERQQADTAARSASDDRFTPTIDEEMQRKLAALRTRLREAFGAVVMAMMLLPRYRHMSLADLQHLVFEPLVNDRIAIAHPRDKEGRPLQDLAGIAIWASVSEEVDRKIREQIRAGVFPVRLKPEEWRSGQINWLLDVIAPTPRAIAAVISSFRQVIGRGELRLHPIVSRMLDKETLEKLGVRRMSQEGQAAQTSQEPSAGSAAASTSPDEGGTAENADDTFDFTPPKGSKPH